MTLQEQETEKKHKEKCTACGCYYDPWDLTVIESGQWIVVIYDTCYEYRKTLI